MVPCPAVQGISSSLLRSSRFGIVSHRNRLPYACHVPLTLRLSCRSRSGHFARVFTTKSRHRKDDGRIRTLQEEAARTREVKESIKPETVQKDQGIAAATLTNKQDALLAEQTVSNREQRKADWAIIRQMSRYLWPKDNLGTRLRVGLSVGLLVGAKVRVHFTDLLWPCTHSLRRYSMYKYPSTSSPSWMA